MLVIELKRGRTPRDVIAQALEYAGDVPTWDYARLNARAIAYFQKRGLAYESLLGGFQDVFDVPAGEFEESKFNGKQRVFIVAEVTEKVERTARWLLQRGVEITCIRYECFTTGEDQLFLDFQEVVRPEETASSASPTRGLPVSPSEEDVISKMSGPTRGLYEGFRAAARSFGAGVQTGATSGYLKFTARRNFAELHPQRERLKVYVRPEGFSLAQDEWAEVGGIKVHRISDKFLWTLNHEFFVDESTNLTAIIPLLRRSYEAAR